MIPCTRTALRQPPGAVVDPGLITGDRDFFGPPANEDMLELVPDARSVLLSDAGHFVWFDEPDRFREELTRFLLD